ncbi:hypothetical protein B0H13DRAFT_1850423 [Mycena leptocephala]|nr:hypothetical protein B0H13DRAFT_1850423 [Mycena leptocephala]
MRMMNGTARWTLGAFPNNEAFIFPPEILHAGVSNRIEKGWPAEATCARASFVREGVLMMCQQSLVTFILPSRYQLRIDPDLFLQSITMVIDGERKNTGPWEFAPGHRLRHREEWVWTVGETDEEMIDQDAVRSAAWERWDAWMAVVATHIPSVGSRGPLVYRIPKPPAPGDPESNADGYEGADEAERPVHPPPKPPKRAKRPRKTKPVVEVETEEGEGETDIEVPSPHSPQPLNKADDSSEDEGGVRARDHQAAERAARVANLAQNAAQSSDEVDDDGPRRGTGSDRGIHLAFTQRIAFGGKSSRPNWYNPSTGPLYSRAEQIVQVVKTQPGADTPPVPIPLTWKASTHIHVRVPGVYISSDPNLTDQPPKKRARGQNDTVAASVSSPPHLRTCKEHHLWKSEAYTRAAEAAVSSQPVPRPECRSARLVGSDTAQERWNNGTLHSSDEEEHAMEVDVVRGRQTSDRNPLVQTLTLAAVTRNLDDIRASWNIVSASGTDFNLAALDAAYSALLQSPEASTTAPHFRIIWSGLDQMQSVDALNSLRALAGCVLSAPNPGGLERPSGRESAQNMDLQIGGRLMAVLERRASRHEFNSTQYGLEIGGTISHSCSSRRTPCASLSLIPTLHALEMKDPIPNAITNSVLKEPTPSSREAAALPALTSLVLTRICSVQTTYWRRSRVGRSFCTHLLPKHNPYHAAQLRDHRTLEGAKNSSWVRLDEASKRVQIQVRR